MNLIHLGVNIDHIATLRNVRGNKYPDLVHAAAIAEMAGADSITIHLREDRRHVLDRDVQILSETLQTQMNLEMAMTDEMIKIALNNKPEYVCFVPEKRKELTTEGGLDVVRQAKKVKTAIKKLNAAGIRVSLFIDSDHDQIDAATSCGASFIELHTGAYANAKNPKNRQDELKKIADGAAYAASMGIAVNAGHGLNYYNVSPVAALPEIHELNIGHSIISRAVFDGLQKAIADMKVIIQSARN
ncbi:pyridoxine 5'-phosphate synthase [Candidatus Photodesmus blepharus]|uniref:Pyridoxine 5'-phosphate synthase n=1 Tax=Candidatus Photodesmus blepharonis TaxID=1179155 RepID=A0A084CNV3_9GAMM|nr:pyridoxine 5'-phosphate synthase [Candidatus Photodesmus blepharus]KEY91482.1 pyridoxine 5'-phosphate synthase [Candidatus Photodesmus blepharus]